MTLAPNRGLFVIGVARSGTTALQNALNHSGDICLLGEPDLPVDDRSHGFGHDSTPCITAGETSKTTTAAQMSLLYDDLGIPAGRPIDRPQLDRNDGHLDPAHFTLIGAINLGVIGYSVTTPLPQ